MTAPTPTLDALAAGVRAGDRAMLGRAISLVESTLPAHEARAAELLDRLHAADAHASPAFRVGITGVPGAGKSTFIERLGVMLADEGRRVAVLAVDPSSTLTGGSILGDRTRMPRLSAHPRAFIRPSPSGGSLGGVARRTREVMALCEAAGFDVILVETVGVGQSETVVADMTDQFLALALPGAGDELQAVKRGLLERVDAVAVNKADGDQAEPARRAAAELALALHVARASRGHGPHGEPLDEDVPVLTCSARTGAGVAEVWRTLERRLLTLRAGGTLTQRRREQGVRWLAALVDERLRRALAASPRAAAALARAQERVRLGEQTPARAADEVVAAFLGDRAASTDRAASAPHAPR